MNLILREEKRRKETEFRNILTRDKHVGKIYDGEYNDTRCLL